MDKHRPVVVLCEGHLLKVDVQAVALGGLQNPVARQVIAVVARETRRDDASHCGILYHTSAGSCREQGERGHVTVGRRKRGTQRGDAGVWYWYKAGEHVQNIFIFIFSLYSF